MDGAAVFVVIGIGIGIGYILLLQRDSVGYSLAVPTVQYCCCCYGTAIVVRHAKRYLTQRSFIGVIRATGRALITARFIHKDII